MTVKWRGEQVRERLERELAKRVERAAEHVKTQTQKNISTSAQKGATRSQPFEFPHRETSRLHNSIFTRMDRANIEAIVGTNVKYARRLELGFIGTDSQGRFVRQLPRPFLRKTFLLELVTVRRIIAGR